MKNNLIKILIINMFVLIFFNYAHPVTPDMLQAKNMPNSINGIMFSLMSLGMVIGSPFFGKKIKTTKNTKIMIISVVGYAIAQQLFGFGNTVIIMGLGRFLSGFFAGGWMITSLEYINRNTDEDNKTKFFAYMAASSAIAAIIGQLSAGYIGTFINYHYIFILQALGLIVISFFMSILKLPMKTNKTVENVKSYLNLKQAQKLLYPLLMMVLFSYAYTSMNSQLGYFVSEHLGKSSLYVGLIASYINILTIVINIFIVNKVYKKISSPNIFILTSSITLIGAIILTKINIALIFIPITLILVGVVSYKPVLQKIILINNQEYSGEVLGYLNSANSIGMVLGSFISGLLYSIAPIFVIYSLMLIVSLILIFSLLKKHKN